MIATIKNFLITILESIQEARIKIAQSRRSGIGR